MKVGDYVCVTFNRVLREAAAKIVGYHNNEYLIEYLLDIDNPNDKSGKAGYRETMDRGYLRTMKAHEAAEIRKAMK